MVQSYELGNCKIVQICFPALDAGSKDRGSATITLQPAHIDMTLGSNARISTASEKNTAAFITSNFRLNIDGVPTNRVSKISAITVCPHEKENGSGKDELDFIEFKTIQISIPESETANGDWQKWLIEFVRNEQQEGRNGSLQFLGPDLKKVLLEISLTNIFIVSTLFHDSGAADQVARASIELLFDLAAIINKTTPDDTKFIRSGVGLKLPDPKAPEIKISDIKNIKPGR